MSCASHVLVGSIEKKILVVLLQIVSIITNKLHMRLSFLKHIYDVYNLYLLTEGFKVTKKYSIKKNCFLYTDGKNICYSFCPLKCFYSANRLKYNKKTL